MIEYIRAFDNSMLEFIQRNMRSGALDMLMPYVSYLGSGGFIWIVAAFALLFKKRNRVAAVAVIIALILCALIGNLGLKPLFARLRPYELKPDMVLLIPRLADFSFPSGHTMSSFAAALVMFRRSRRLGACAFIVGAAIAFSRLYLYVHYPTDVIGGVIFGLAAGFAALRLSNAIARKSAAFF